MLGVVLAWLITKLFALANGLRVSKGRPRIELLRVGQGAKRGKQSGFRRRRPWNVLDEVLRASAPLFSAIAMFIADSVV